MFPQLAVHSSGPQAEYSLNRSASNSQLHRVNPESPHPPLPAGGGSPPAPCPRVYIPPALLSRLAGVFLTWCRVPEMVCAFPRLGLAARLRRPVGLARLSPPFWVSLWGRASHTPCVRVARLHPSGRLSVGASRGLLRLLCPPGRRGGPPAWTVRVPGGSARKVLCGRVTQPFLPVDLGRPRGDSGVWGTRL